MFIGLIRCVIIATGTMVISPLPILNGQQGPAEQTQSGMDAYTLFERGDYREALSGFRDLQKNSPDLPGLEYYLGRCQVELGEELDEAIEHLYRAVRGRNGREDALFYLARAHHLNYNFPEALKYYRLFESGASRQVRKETRIGHLIATCSSAMEITSTYNPYEVMNVTFIDLTDSTQFSQIKMKGGDLQYVPAAYSGEKGGGQGLKCTGRGLTEIMFLPPRAVRGEYAYFAAVSKNGREGTQLYRIRKGMGSSWSEPEEIRALNSDGNEILPYFDPVENDLYFASDGRPGIGGFDLYRSHYDMERDQWSEPLNMGFPINSTMDELLLLPGADLGMMMFFSNRQGPDSLLTVYRVHLIEPKKKTDVNDHQMLKEIAGMEGKALEIQAELEALPSESYEQPLPGEAQTESDAEQTGNRVTTSYRILETGLSGSSGLSSSSGSSISSASLIYAEATRHRIKADSLNHLAEEARLRVDQSDDPNDRWVWQKQIILWEKKSRDQREMANELFALYEADRSAAQKSVPASIEQDTVINGLTVFRFTSSAAVEGEPGTPPRESGPEKKGEQPISRFQIMDHSPYQDARSIPMDVPIPAGTFYRIQLGVYSAEVETGTFKGITPVTGERIPDRGLVKYYAGKFSRYDDAASALDRIQSLGFGDAFIVAWYNGEQITTHRAKQLE